jgi:hypothetical protein
MPAHWVKALKMSKATATIQPCERRWTPPAMMTTNETRVHSSMTTAKVMRKPTVRHMLQKDESLTQSVVRGKGTHSPVTAEQRLWRPYEYWREPFWGVYVRKTNEGIEEEGAQGGIPGCS